MKYFVLILFSVLSASAASTFTEFYVDSSGGTTNSGHTSDAVPTFAFQNGGWNSVSGVFTAIGASLAAVTNNAWASVYVDGATEAVFIGRITAVDDTADTITVSVVYKSGTAPSTSATARSIVVGGCWPFPNGSSPASDFPFRFLEASAINTSSNPPCINIKSNIYILTANIQFGGSLETRVQGYKTTLHDGGKPILRGAVGASFVLVDVNGTLDLWDFELDPSPFTSGTSAATSSANSRVRFTRVLCHNSRGAGFSFGSTHSTTVECESYNNAGTGYTFAGTYSFAINCIAHNNTSHGIFLNSGGMLANCIAYSNGITGFNIAASTHNTIVSACDSYTNGNGFLVSSAGGTRYKIVNCNVLRNTTNGFRFTFSQDGFGEIWSCGFGTGTMTNGQGNWNDIGDQRTDIVGSVFYPADATPWINPNFNNYSLSRPYGRIGYGSFTQTNINFPTNTISYPVIGSVQYPATNILGGNAVFAQ